MWEIAPQEEAIAWGDLFIGQSMHTKKTTIFSNVIPGSVVSRVFSGYFARSLVGQWTGSVRTAFGPNFPINRWRLPKFVHFRSLLPLQKRWRLRKSELDKNTMLFFATTCISTGGTQPALSRVTPAWKKLQPLQRAGGNKWSKTSEHFCCSSYQIQGFLLEVY
jgi:hypothetical protein